MKEFQEYLGDGLYAEYDGFMFTLWCDRVENGKNWVGLEPEVLGAFFRFVERIRSLSAEEETP